MRKILLLMVILGLMLLTSCDNNTSEYSEEESVF